MIPRGGEPRHDERVRVEVLAGEQRPEDERAERGAEERAEEDVRDPAGAALGRIHVRRRGTGEQDRALRDPDEREPEDHERGGVERAAERGGQTAGDPGQAAAGEDRHAAVPVHRAAGGERGQRAGGEEDGRAEPEDPLDAGDEHERHRPDGDGELDHPGERRQRRGEQDRVAANREALHRPTLSQQRCRRARRGTRRRRRATGGGRTGRRAGRARAGRSRRRGARRRARAGTAPTARSRSGSAAGSTPRVPGMRRHEVPEQDLVLEPELGQRPVHDRGGRLGRPGPGQLALGGERDPGDARSAVAGRLADEQHRSLARRSRR